MSYPFTQINELTQLPANSPWGFATIARNGFVLSANAHMRQYYFAGKTGGFSIEEVFSFPDGRSFNDVMEPSAGESICWVGRVTPSVNAGAVSSLEILIEQDSETPDRLWLYTLDHPSIRGVQRFSSRSELQMLQVLLENTLEYVWISDVNDRIIIANDAFKDAVSVDASASLTGRTIGEFATHESAHWLAKIAKKVRATGKPSINEVSHFKFKNGTEHWLQMSTVPVRLGDGAFLGSVSVARVVDDLKHTEAELREAIKQAHAASRAKGEFLAAISHEIRTPINGIIGAAELCQETELAAEKDSYTQTVLKCSGTLLSLINDVLDFSKIEAGQLQLENLTFDLGELLDSVAKEFIQEVRKKGVELIVTSDEALPDFVLGDPTRLKQIVYNLLGNAVKFTAEGSIVIRTEVLWREGDQIRLLIDVEDTGIGVSKDRIDSIFTSFTQGDMSTTREYGGTGLGLAISRELTELMGGELSVKSTPGVGSAFSCEIPLQVSEAVSGQSESKSPEPGVVAAHAEVESKTLSILLAEDNPINQQVAQVRIKKLGHKVKLVENGRDAIEAYKDGSFDCILMDIQMPEMDGHAATRAIRKFEKDGGLSPIYIIAITAHAMKGDREKCLSVGMSDYISKPFRIADLKRVFQAVSYSLEGHQLDQATVNLEQIRSGLSSIPDDEIDDFKEMSGILLKTLSKDITRLEHAVQVLDFAEAHFVAHSIKGSVGIFYQSDLVKLGSELEEASKSKNTELTRKLASEFIAQLYLLEDALRERFM